MKAYVVAFCAVFLATSALAQPSGTAGGNGAEPSNATAAPEVASHGDDHARDGQRQICRRVEADTSSRMGSRHVCHTAEEWRALQNGA